MERVRQIYDEAQPCSNSISSSPRRKFLTSAVSAASLFAASVNLQATRQPSLASSDSWPSGHAGVERVGEPGLGESASAARRRLGTALAHELSAQRSQ